MKYRWGIVSSRYILSRKLKHFGGPFNKPQVGPFETIFVRIKHTELLEGLSSKFLEPSQTFPKILSIFPSSDLGTEVQKKNCKSATHGHRHGLLFVEPAG